MLLFLITSLQGTTPLTLFYKFFHYNIWSDDQQTSTGTSEILKMRKEQVRRVVARLHSIYQFHSVTGSKSQEIDMQILNSDDVVPEFETCHFRLLQNDPFPEEMRVIWTAVNGLGFTFVCHMYENRVQAEITLRVLIRQLHELCRVVLQPNEILSRPEKVEIVLNKFVPDGTPLLMNHRVIRQLERETEPLLKAASAQ